MFKAISIAGKARDAFEKAAALDPNFQGFATVRADAKGEWRIVTIKPGGYDSPIGHRPPHIHFDLRSEKTRSIAQLYFPEEAEGNAKDTLYKALTPADVLRTGSTIAVLGP